jgi:TonB family protein
MRTIIFTLILISAPAAAQDRQFVHDNASERKVALVIGNGAYDSSPLKNPVNDATDIAGALRSFGFDVIFRENLDQIGMKRAIREFGTKIRGGGVALFYYAGHGVQVKGTNYLVPVDAKVTTEEEIEYETVDAGFVLAQMDSAKTDLNIVILDACRTNPFARSFRSASNGLAQMDAPSGTLIAYATAPGSVASDNATARNGIYTQELLRVIATPSLTIEEVFKRVRISVRGLTQGKQTPWESSSLVGNFSFQPVSMANTNEPVVVTRIDEKPSKGTADPVLFPESEAVFTQGEVDQTAKFLSLPKPGYTDVARQNAVQGVVKLQVVLTADGSVGKIKIISGLPNGLSEKAIEAARQARFTPAMKDGKAVSVQVVLEYNFSLY